MERECILPFLVLCEDISVDDAHEAVRKDEECKFLVNELVKATLPFEE